MFDPKIYNVSAASGNVVMTLEYPITNNTPSFTWTGDVNIMDDSYSSAYMVKAELSADSDRDLLSFMVELNQAGLSTEVTQALARNGYYTTQDQSTAAGIYDILQSFVDNPSEYGTVENLSTVVLGSLTLDYDSNKTTTALMSTVQASVTVLQENLVYTALLIQDAGEDTEGNASLDITDVSKTIAYNESTASFFIATTDINSVSASFDGNLTVTNHTITAVSGGYQLSVTTANNTTQNELQSIITVSGTTLQGSTITDIAVLIKKAVPGTITLTPSTATVDKKAGTLTFTINAVGITNLQTSYSGTTVTSATINNSTLTVNYGVNNTGSTVTNTVTVSGKDSYNTTVSDIVTITQYETESTIQLAPRSNVIAASAVNAQFDLTTVGVNNITVTYSGDIQINNYSITNQLLTFDVDPNLTYNPKASTITVKGDGLNGEEISDTVTLIQKGIAGTLSISPTETTISDSITSVSFTITATSMYNLTASSTGDINFSSISINQNQVVASLPANTTYSNKTGIITVTGNDGNGDTFTASATVTQYGKSEITISPDSKTLNAEETTAYYAVRVYNVSNPTVSFNGTVNIDRYTFSVEGTDSTLYALYVYTQNNESSAQLTTTITISGTNELGTTVSDTATLIKNAPSASSITLTPTNRTLGYEAGSTTFTINATNITSELTVGYSGNINVLSRVINGDTLTVTYDANTSVEALSGTIAVGGSDAQGNNRSATADLYQAGRPVQSSLSLSPSTRSVTSDSGSVTFTINATDINTDTLYTDSTGTMNITSRRISSDKQTLTVVYGANSASTSKQATVTVTGTDLAGETQTATATITQAAAPATTYTFEFTPSSQSSITVSRVSNSVRYTINSVKSSSATVQLGYTATISNKTGTWPTNPTIQYDSNELPYVVLPANSGSTRTVRITFTQNESGMTLVSTITQNGSGTVSSEFLPIWKENELIDTNGSSFIEYHITLNSEIIYAGKAYKYPEDTNIKWTINDVCSNYLGNGIIFNNGIHKIPDYCKTFTVETNTSVIMNDTFYNSWAYEDTDYWLSDPIDYRVDPRQWLPVSFLSSNSRNIRVGNTSYTASASNDGWTVMTNLNNLTIDCGSAFTVTPGIGRPRNYRIDCGDFVLYYANAYGGWDALLVKGTTKKTDNIEHLNYRRKSKNFSEFSKVNYQNNITPTWSLNTGITINGKKMYHLLESTMVYLHNLENNEIIPVVITNSQCEYLDYTNNGKRPYYYNITVEESNLKLRK